MNAPLKDQFGRSIEYLRISVTDRCNFRCQYCMPAEGLPWLDHSEVLTFEEIERLVWVLVELGDTSVGIAVAHPRRAPSMDAARAIIEEIKKRVPIWKREHYVDGTREWVDPTRATAATPAVER